MTKSGFAVFALCLVLGGLLDAQQPAANLRIYAFGGFLGYKEGLVDPDDIQKANGGLFGVQQWLDSGQAGFKNGRDVLLLAGNNLSLDAADHAVQALEADAVAISIDDFLRALRSPDRAAALAHQLSQSDQPPFVVSNAFIRIEKDGLNRITGDGVDLEIAEDRSIGWVSSIRASCDKECPDVVTATLAEARARAGAPAITATVSKSRDTRHLRIAFKPSLRPGHSYTLTLSAGTKALGTYWFATHEAITRARAKQMPAALLDLPVQFLERDLDAGSPTPVVILGAVDPDTRRQLAADRWRWSAAAQPAMPCAGDECAIDFMPATDAFAAIKSQFDAFYKDQPAPIFVLVSGLNDPQTLALLSAGESNIRFVVLDPDASALGRDIGDESIVNGGPDSDQTLTQIWARPEWIGTQAEIMQARMTWNKTAKKWTMADPDVRVVDIPSVKFGSRTDSTKNEIEYFIDKPPRQISGPLPLYPATPQVPNPALAPAALWVTKEGTAALILDEMRRYLTADVALIRSHAIDQDIVSWLAAEAKIHQLDTMSRFILEKLLYQMEHFVSADVEGGKLADTLDSLVKAETAAGETVFTAGLGATGALAAVDKDHLLINERRIIPSHFYRIALPQSMAEAAKLTLAGGELPSILDRLDLRIRSERLALLSNPQLDTYLEKNYAARPRYYFNISPAHFEFHRASIDDNDKLLLANLPLVGKSVQAEEQWAASGFGDLGVDFRRIALRATADLKYAKKTVDDKTTNPSDEWTAGFRADWKWQSRLIDRVFVGWFAQSWFRDHTDSLTTPTRQVASAISDQGELLAKFNLSGKPVSTFVQRPLYRFTRFGVELSSKAWPWLTFKDLRLAFDVGTQQRDRSGVKIGQERHPDPAQTIETFFQSSRNFLNSWFDRRPDLFATPQTLLFDYADPRRQRRVQTDGAIELTVPAAWAHGMKLTSTVQYRKYLNDQRENFTPDWTLDTQTKLEWLIVGRLKIGPFVNLYRARAKGVNDIMKYRDHGIGIDFPVFVAVRRIPIFR